MSLFGYKATHDLNLLCCYIIMQVLFPAAFIAQQIVQVRFTDSCHANCALIALSTTKNFSLSLLPFSCFSTLLLFSLHRHHHHLMILHFRFYYSDFNFYAMRPRIFATLLYCFNRAISKDPGEGGAKGALAAPLFYLVLLWIIRFIIY